MRRSLLVLLSAACSAALVLGVTRGQEGPASKPAKTVRQTRAEEVASDWVNAFVVGDLETLKGLLAVPFAWDRKKIIEDEAELKALFDEAFGKKRSKNKGIEVLSTEVTLDTREIKDRCLPYDFVIVTLTAGRPDRKDRIEVCLRPAGESFKVVGISD